MTHHVYWPRAAGLASLFLLTFPVQKAQAQAQAIGQFEDHGDMGIVLHPGSAAFDSATDSYTLTGSGENMWATADAFQFVWKKVSGDITLTADIAFPTATGNPHKKAVLMMRQSLDPDSAYVDTALHVAGLTSLQSRAEKGDATHEVGIDNESAVSLRIEKRGSYFYMFVARKGEKLHFGGGSMRLELKEPFFIGLGVCAHDKDAIETAVFSNVTIGTPPRGKFSVYSTLETISASSTDQRVVAVFNERVESPTWSSDGANLLFKRGKKIEQIPATGGKVEASAIPLPANKSRQAKKSTLNYKPSPDGLRSASLSYSGKKPMDATLDVKTTSDGKDKLLAKFRAAKGTLSEAPWSPDGKRLAFVSYQLIPKE